MLQYLIAPYEADVYIATWLTDEKGERVNIQRLIDLARPVAARIYSPQTFPQPAHFGRPLPSLLPMLWMVREAERARVAGGREYDLVVRCRFDLTFWRPVALATQPGVIGVPDYGIGAHWRVNDQFAFGNSQDMALYARCFEFALSNISTPQRAPENVLKRHLELQGLQARREADLRYFIRRTQERQTLRELRYFKVPVSIRRRLLRAI